MLDVLSSFQSPPSKRKKGDTLEIQGIALSAWFRLSVLLIPERLQECLRTKRPPSGLDGLLGLHGEGYNHPMVRGRAGIRGVVETITGVILNLGTMMTIPLSVASSLKSCTLVESGGKKHLRQNVFSA